MYGELLAKVLGRLCMWMRACMCVGARVHACVCVEMFGGGEADLWY